MTACSRCGRRPSAAACSHSLWTTLWSTWGPVGVSLCADRGQPGTARRTWRRTRSDLRGRAAAGCGSHRRTGHRAERRRVHRPCDLYPSGCLRAGAVAGRWLTVPPCPDRLPTLTRTPSRPASRRYRRCGPCRARPAPGRRGRAALPLPGDAEPRTWRCGAAPGAAAPSPPTGRAAAPSCSSRRPSAPPRSGAGWRRWSPSCRPARSAAAAPSVATTS